MILLGTSERHFYSVSEPDQPDLLKKKSIIPSLHKKHLKKMFVQTDNNEQKFSNNIYLRCLPFAHLSFARVATLLSFCLSYR